MGITLALQNGKKATHSNMTLKIGLHLKVNLSQFIDTVVSHGCSGLSHQYRHSFHEKTPSIS